MTPHGKDIPLTALRRWTRPAGLVLTTVALGVALAPVARATDITNPAEHPAPITLEIDGQTYRDGADTLPGYDDYACTPIPNVQYDFGNDEIQYYDGQGNEVKTAHWTEWSRISSYQAWADQQQQGNTSPGTSTPSSGDATPTPTSQTTTSAGASSGAATSPAATSPAATSPTTTGSATKTTTSAAKTKTKTKTKLSAARTTTTSAAKTKTTTSASTTAKTTGSATEAKGSAGTRRAASPTTSSTHGTATTSHAKRSGTSSAKHRAAAQSSAGASTDAAGDAPDTSTGASAAAPSQGAAAPAPAAQPKYQLVSDKGAGTVGDTRPVGVGILIAVFAAAGLAFVIGFGRRGLRASS
jgi:hypothetical protein